VVGADTMSYTQAAFSACAAAIGGWWLTCPGAPPLKPAAEGDLRRVFMARRLCRQGRPCKHERLRAARAAAAHGPAAHPAPARSPRATAPPLLARSTDGTPAGPGYGRSP